jgi:hypothetical protein|nr:MAG TPA: ERF superfamily protein [Caudoviricetes sp.]
MAGQLNLVQKLAKIRAISDVVSKEKRGYNYTYADITTILANITAGMKKYGVSLIPSVVPGTAEVSQNVVTNTKFDKTGKAYDNTATEMLVKAEMVFKWVNDENPEEFIEVPWFVTGSQTDPSQAFGSGLTYCTRYFLCNYFQIAQSDSDVDTYRSKQKAAEESEEKAIAEEIINGFDMLVKQFLADNSDKVDEVKKFISKYAKNANYLAIKEPMLASKLLADFKAKYKVEG